MLPWCKERFDAVMLALDILLCALTFGQPRETLSGRWGRWKADRTDNPRRRFANWICPILTMVLKRIGYEQAADHCARVREKEER